MPATAGQKTDYGSTSVEEGVVLRVGKVTSQPRKHFLRFTGLADFLADNLSDLGVADVEVMFAKSNQEMLEMLNSGRIDFISETMFSSMFYVEEAGVEVLLREWRNNVPEYHTVFFARNDSNITSLSDLQGRILAFEDPGSTSAYFLPRTILVREGFRLVEMAWPGPETVMGPDKGVGYVFARSEENIPIWVHENRVQAGVLSNTDWLDEDLFPPKIKKDLHIFHETEPVPRSLLSARKELPESIRKRVKQRLLDEYGESREEGVVTKFSDVPKYDQVPSSEILRFQALYMDYKAGM